MSHTGEALCVCGHRQVAHEHYRAGSDCASCPPQECLRFRSSGGLAAIVRLIAGPLTRSRTRGSGRVTADPSPDSPSRLVAI